MKWVNDLKKPKSVLIIIVVLLSSILVVFPIFFVDTAKAAVEEYTLLDTQYDGIDHYHGVWGDGTYIYATCLDGGIRAYSFDGTSLALLDTQDDGGSYKSVWCDGTYIYAACHDDGIRAYSFDGTTFTLLATQDDSDRYWRVWGDGTYIYVALMSEFLFVGGIRAYTFDGTSFTLLDTLDDGGNYWDVWGDGTYIYVANYEDGIRAYSFDGTSFTLLDTQDDGGKYFAVWGDGTYIYVVCKIEGIRAYSFDGTTFTLLATQDDGDRYWDLWGDGTYIHAASRYDGIHAYSFDGTTFTLLDTQYDGGEYYAAWGDGTYIYVANDIGGIYAYFFEVNNPPTITSWNADTEPGATSGWDWDNNDLQVDWTVADADTDSLTLLWTFSKGGTPSDPTTASYNGRKTGIESGSYTMNDQDLDWTSGTWENYRGTVNFKFRLHDGTNYSTTIETDSLTGGIDGTDPSTTIMDQPDASDGPDSIYGTATDTICYVASVDMYIKNTTDATWWTGSVWSTETWLSSSANDSFDSASENWNYDSSGVIWGDKNYEMGANTTDESGRDDPFPATDTFTITLLVSPIAPIADFTFTPSNPSLGELVSFYDLSTDEDGRIVSWSWMLGDGNTAIIQNPTNTHNEERYYTISLMVTDDDGLTDTAIKILWAGGREGDIYIPPFQPPKYPNNPFSVPEMYALLRANIPSSAEVVIVVIDSGNYPRTYDGVDLTPIIDLPHASYRDGVDEFGHGTWVNYAVRYGIHEFCPNAIQYSIRAFDERGQSTPDIFLQCLDMAKDLNPDIVTISAGIIGTADDVFSKKVGELRRAGIFVTVSAGNSGPQPSTIMSPAIGADAVAIGAIDPLLGSIMDLSDDEVTEWSSRGPIAGIFPKPDFAAPGESIVGPWLLGENVASGTSMAAPLVASCVLQIIATNKGLLDAVQLVYGNQVYLGLIETSLIDSAYDKGDPDSYGWGIPNTQLAAQHAWLKAVWYLAVFVLSLVVLVVSIFLVWSWTGGRKKR